MVDSENGQVPTKVHGRINYPDIYKSLILSISHTVDSKMKIELIENLSALLEPYKDKNEHYMNTIQKITDNLQYKIENNEGSMTELKKEMEKKFRALIKLAYECGFMPQREIPTKQV